ncbi:BRCT domain-containing protein [Pleurostoma richardsiae]|uniref:BRCT domain-containing protein n=1 Tax=Pleurostoma richardsiae TaxID=41990 RepID=A0AA38VTZ6_9PEZI|nr:BRCT domain-containing protein [Pleurostoma richardsiae]
MAEEPDIFSLCTIGFVQSKAMPLSVVDELVNTVKKYGAEVIERNPDGSLPVLQCSHIIAASIDFEEYTEAMAMMVPVVTSNWITMSLHKGRQAQVRPYSPDPRMIFSNVVLTCADIPLTDKEAIIGATLAMGGMESKDLSRMTTHICALSLDHPKCQQAIEKKLKCKIVLPHWFDDCFKLGKKIDEGPYLLPDPEILTKAPDDSLEVPLSQHIEGATSAYPDYVPPPVETREGLVVFKNKKVSLSYDLGIKERLRKILGDLIKSSGGEVVGNDVEACDWFVCQFRDGPQYVRASQLGKDVGNLAWLYHLITHNEWTSPLRRLLHYPVPKEGLPGFKDLKITLSNYGGEARIYLENLVVAAGATYTKTMKADNTHLITARQTSEKCEAARDWNIHMVNHLWIEESYAKCELQSITNPKYTHFPPRTNLGEIIGQTFFDEEKLHAMYYPGGEEELDAAAKRRRKIRDVAQGNAYTHGPAAGASIGRQRRQQVDVLKDGAPTPSRATPSKVTKPVATPARGGHIRTGKENETPSIYSSGSRSAKDKALNKLHNLAPDIALYEKEKKRSAKDGHGPWGGKRAADQIDKERSIARSSSPVHEPPEDEEEAKRPAKRQKPTLPPVEMRVVLTGYRRWVGDKNAEDADRRKLRNLGIQIVQENVPCDYLAAPQLIRTVKFLRTLAHGPEVISSKFIDDCLDTGKVPSVDKYKLKDKENESRWGVKLEQSIKRAKANKGRLLWHVPIYCTADIKNGPDSYKDIAAANQATFMVYRARSGQTIKPTNPEEDGPPEPVYLLTSNSKAERDLWPKFEAMAKRGNMEPRIVCSDWLLDVAMKQELFFDEKYLARNFFA